MSSYDDSDSDEGSENKYDMDQLKNNKKVLKKKGAFGRHNTLNSVTKKISK